MLSKDLNSVAGSRVDGPGLSTHGRRGSLPTLWNFRAAYGSLARCGIVVRLADVQMRRIRDGMKLTRWDKTDKWMVSGWDWMVVDLGRSIMLRQFMSPRSSDGKDRPATSAFRRWKNKVY
jgi:hypothetical protein